MVSRNQTFVVGWPIEHSRSPLIHNHWIKKHGLEGKYNKIARSPDDIEAFLNGLPQSEFLGGNVTIPHKETAFNAVDSVDAAAQKLGAVNTVWHQEGKLFGSNTDGYGFLANLDDQMSDWDCENRKNRGALVLGAGGASRAIIQGLIDRGFLKISIANRTKERARHLANQFGSCCTYCSMEEINSKNLNPSLIVNTTAVGMNDGKSPIPLAEFSADTIINDIVYTPLWTPLLLEARSRNMKVVDGLGMLLHQAVPGFEKWYGVRPQVTEELRNILLRDLGEVL